MRRSLLPAAILFAAVTARADVRGAAVTAEGLPVAGAKVSLYAAPSASEMLRRMRSGGEETPIATAESDAKGNFKLPVGRSGNYVLSINATGYTPSGIETDGLEDLGGILLRPAKMKSGRVTANGKPVANARLLFSRSGSYRTTTADDGTFSVPDPAVWWPVMFVGHPDFAIHQDASHPTGAPLSLDVRLEPGVTLSGRVVARDGKSGAKATLSVDGASAGESGEDGAFTIEHVSPKWRVLVAEADGLTARARAGAALTLQLEPALTFRGVIVDAASGMPLERANVNLLPETGGDIVPHHAITDAKGVFAMPSLFPGNYRIFVGRSGYDNPMLQQTLTATTEPRTIALQKEGRVRGTVTDGERNPVGAVQVRVSPRGYEFYGGFPSTLVSAPDGRYVARVPGTSMHTELEVIASRSGFAVVRDGPHRLEPGGEETVNLVLDRGIALTGIVKNAAGEPLRGVAVGAQEIVSTRMQPQFRGPAAELPVTDAEGRFTLQLRPAAYALFFRLAGYAPKRLAEVNVAAGMAPVEVTLDAGATISGRVVNADGKPMPGMRVTANSDMVPQNTTTDASGAFTLGDLPAQMIAITVFEGNGRSRTTRQIKAPAENVVIELVPTVRVSGRVEAKDGAAVRDFEVGIAPPRQTNGWYNASIETTGVHNAEGKFVLDAVQVAPAELQVSAPGYVSARLPLRLEKGKDVENLEVSLERAGSLRGRVTSESGAPLAQVNIIVETDDSKIEPASTDADGEYRLDSIPPGEQIVTFMKPGLQMVKKNVTIDTSERRLDVQLPKGLTLTGRVVNESGAPLADAELFASSEEAGRGFGRATTDASGRFRIEGLGDGLYQIRATRRGYVNADLRDVNVATTRELNVTMSGGATITGRVTGIDPSRLRDVMIFASGRGQSAQASADANGNFRLEGAPLGKIVVRATTRGGNGSRSAEVVELDTESGRTYTVDLEFREHNTVRGRVTRRGVPLRAGGISFTPKSGPRDSASGAIDANGQYQISGVRSGEHDVSIMDVSTRGIRFVVSRTISQSQTLDFDINPASLSGRVVNAATGEAIVDAAIELERTGAETIRGRSGSDGGVLFEDIPAGTYTLRVLKEGFGSYISTQTFADGATASLDARLTPSAGLTLRVIDGRTNRAIVAWLVARASDGSIAYNGRPTPRPDGTLLVPLAPGTYRINILPEQVSMSYINATSPGSETVTLMPGGTLEISRPGFTRARILAADGSPYNVSLGGTTGEFQISTGAGITEMAPGSYTLQLIDADGKVTQSVPFTIQAERTTRLTL